jgi:hypothetical protein
LAAIQAYEAKGETDMTANLEKLVAEAEEWADMVWPSVDDKEAIDPALNHADDLIARLAAALREAIAAIEKEKKP